MITSTIMLTGKKAGRTEGRQEGKSCHGGDPRRIDKFPSNVLGAIP